MEYLLISKFPSWNINYKVHTLESLTDFPSEVAKASVSSSGTRRTHGQPKQSLGFLGHTQKSQVNPHGDSFDNRRQNQGKMGKLAQTGRDQMVTKTKGRV